MKQQARIEKWKQVGEYLVGEIKDHPRQSEFKGKVQKTSKLVLIDRRTNIAETENTIYLLGEPL